MEVVLGVGVFVFTEPFCEGVFGARALFDDVAPMDARARDLPLAWPDQKGKGSRGDATDEIVRNHDRGMATFILMPKR